jgi:predicted amidohydrolase
VIARIALANVAYPDSPDDAVARARRAIADAGRQGALIVAFPECYVPGYRTPDRVIPPPDAAYLERAWTAIAEAARDAGVAVALGTERIVDGNPRISVLVLDRDGRRVGFQDKVQLDPSEDPMYQPGAERHVFEIGPLKFGIAICHEGWRYPETVRWAARRGAHVVFHPHFHWADETSFRPTEFLDPRNTFHEKAMLCRAAENFIWFASINCATEGSGTTSAVVRPDGTVLAWHPYGLDGLLVADIDLDAATALLASRCRYAVA